MVFEADPDQIMVNEWSVIFRSLGALLGDINYYAELSDPYEEPREEPVTTSLSDDIADIYGDLASGLKKWRRGDADDALWDWRLNFAIHWGEHAASALRALHSLGYTERVRFPSAETLAGSRFLEAR